MTEMNLTPIGRIHTPYKTLADCPSAPHAGQEARIELHPAFAPGLKGLNASEVDVLYWFDRAARDVLQSVRPHDGVHCGVFAMRSPHRPNPIALSRVTVLSVDETGLTVSGMDCLDGTVLVDLKPVPRVAT
ncbi:tRNA (N6-threonylcarbamoyladenosine(37)-N6)-methyltransferase TrmO [uncultured Celeribacter sp.]|uniref:tRNA (N6-threonylcarbamoyladenosine(37)-N6)-methyltransferase TrmO n=1 Tax=uncultured Celeribacter sp. TaxID=1303376 RepID=UPI002AA76B37|nr:tRNA (N6-threonylcarbamoyladenosine(37)-N6)-methyltransferase TrmO [uncultured Celeribacter sp.]